jgi:ABC-type amino acid transport substrate-binding protein
MPAPATSLTLLLAVLLGLLGVASPSLGAPALRVRHPPVQDADDRRAEYPIAALRLALERAGANAEVVPAAIAMEQGRAMRALEAGRLIDVMWTVNTPERERRLRVVRTPVDGGMIGWRVLLVRRDALPRFAGVRDRAALAPLLGAQGHDWPDLAILQANGLRVLPTPHYRALFDLLERRRIDYVPRGVGEAIPEARALRRRGIDVEPGLLLHYPTALHFFVRPDNDALAGLLERGLQRAIDDGSLRRLFDRAYADDFAMLDLPRRQRIDLANPDRPAGSVRADAGWWFAPEPRP